MKLQFISQQHIDEAVKSIDANLSRKLMDAAWAAMHGGYQGRKLEGAIRELALPKLKALYTSKKIAAPSVAFASAGEFFQESLAQSASHSSIQSKVMCAINANIKAGKDMDGDGDGPEDAGRCECGCVCGQQYGCQCCSNCSCCAPDYAWCMDLFPEQVVYSMNGKLFQCDYSFDADGDVSLGDPVAVETSYTPVTGSVTSEAAESHRVLACNAVAFEESAYDAKTGKLTMTVIRPGLNKSKSRFYPKETLQRDYHVFENAKMFADHQSDKEAKDRPEGSVNNWVAQINKVWPESDGSIKATAAVIDPPFKEKLSALAEQGLLHEMGVSIRAIGEKAEKDYEGATVVESLIAARSVDFVTYAGAGGQIEAMESARQDSEIDVDLVTEAALRKRRPDLVEIIEAKSTTGVQQMAKTLEMQLQEAQTQLTAVTTERDALKTKVQEAEKTAAKATVSAELTKLLTESKLPEISQNRIRKQFAEAVEVKGIAEAIKEEQEYISHFKGGPVKVTKNLGATDNGTVRESDDKKKPNLEEAFKSIPGMTEADAKLAASR